MDFAKIKCERNSLGDFIIVSTRNLVLLFLNTADFLDQNKEVYGEDCKNKDRIKYTINMAVLNQRTVDFIHLVMQNTQRTEKNTQQKI